MESEEETPFVFSNPNVVEDPFQRSLPVETSIFSPQNRNSIFTFSPPSNTPRSIFSQPAEKPQQVLQDLVPVEKAFKPRITRNLFQPTANVFSQALKATTDSKQAKKSQKSPTLKCFVNNSITCSNVPKNLLTKSAAKQYFLSFGTVAKITIRPRRQVIIVYFATKGEAQNAFNNAGKMDGHEMNIEWTSALAVAQKPLVKKREPRRSTSRSRSSSMIDDKELQSELEALQNLEHSLYTFDDDVEMQPKKPLKVKKAKTPMKEVKKIEKPEFESNIKKVMPSASIEELQVIVRQQAYSSEDKYRILDARDKLMKIRQAKQVNLEMSKVFIGTCPDMCPEKERLMRESQRQVSLYEQVEGSEYRINHTTAVKQYSRSSADQEEPMPHDLRPVRSLKMTMSYILHEIVDLCETPGTNLAEWYNFLWDRTRGIRKDITQQELCCTESVELVEQCARFHIVCSERLCAEESSVFDKKINTENLTKCLQTLKYMYHDLRLKGIVCKNEPEFRAYVILLNLNDSNFMWELQQLPEHIQKSPEVKFAIKVYSAIADNSYCKFFKLVRATTYLNAALLLRYFNQVRMKALSIIIKAYCRTSSTSFGLYELIDILGFEDENEATYFCEQSGLDISVDAQEEAYIVFNKHKFQLPETPLEQGRSFNIIESKRTKNNISIGECISGGKMPDVSYLNHVPHSSFTNDGFLLAESLNAHDQSFDKSENSDTYEYTEDEEMFDSSKESYVSSPVEKAAPVFSFYPKPEEKIGNIFGMTAVKKESIFGTKFANEIKTFNDKHDNKIEKPVSLFSPNFTGNAQPTIFSQFQAPKQSIFQVPKVVPVVKEPEPDLKVQKSAEVFSSPPKVKEKSKEELEREEEQRKKLAEEKRLQEERRKEEERKKLLAEIDEKSAEICKDLCQEVVKEQCEAIAKSEIEKMRILNERSSNLYKSIRDEIVEEECKGILNRELEVLRTLKKVNDQIKRRSILKYFNTWRRHVQKRKAQLRALEDTPVWIQKRSLAECAESLKIPEQDLVLANMRKRFKRSSPEEPSPMPIPLEVLAYNAFVKNQPQSNDSVRVPNWYWKCIISWPEENEDVDTWRHMKNVKKYINPQNVEVDPVIKMFKPDSWTTMFTSIHCCEGIVEADRLDGVDGLIFVLSESEELEDAERRLSKIFYSKQKTVPIPVVVVVIGHNRKLAGRISLQNLREAGFISEVTVFSDDSLNEKRTVKILQLATPWLILNKLPLTPIEIHDSKQVLRDCLMEALWFRIQGHEADPNFLIQFHNEAVKRLVKILLDSDTILYPEFPKEFKPFLTPDRMLPYGYEYSDSEWKNCNYRSKLESKLKKLILPYWNFDWPSADPADLSDGLQMYIKEALPDVDYQFFAGSILSNLYLIIESSVKPSFSCILSYIIEHKIGSEFGNNITVAYIKNRLKNFQKSHWWLNSKLYLKYVEEVQSSPVPQDSSMVHPNPDVSELLTDFDISIDTDDLKTLCEPLETYLGDEKESLHTVISMSDELNSKCKELQTSLKLLEERIKKALEV